MPALIPPHIFRSKHLGLYPALKQDSKDQINFPSRNTRQEQIHIRRLIIKRVFYFKNLSATKTIVLDARYIKKACRNIERSKSFQNIEFTLCEPIVLDLFSHIFRELQKKVINKLSLHIEVRDNNQNIAQLISLLQILKRPKVLELTFSCARLVDFVPCFNALRCTLEQNIFVLKRINLNFEGLSTYFAGDLIKSLRVWRPIFNISIAPSDVIGSSIIDKDVLFAKTEGYYNPRKVHKPLKDLKVKFLYLKRFGNDIMKNFLDGLDAFWESETLFLVLNRLELNKERAEMLENFLSKITELRKLRLIVYYLKYQQMHYKKLLDAIETKGSQLKQLTLGYLVIKEGFLGDLIRVLKSLQGLELLNIYWDIKEVLNHNKEEHSLWQFLEGKQQLIELEMILTCQSSVLEENGGNIQEDIAESLKNLFGYLKKLPKLKRLALILPEIPIDIGEILNDMIIESQVLESIKIDCEGYNKNYLWELNEISKMKDLAIEINTGSDIQLKEFEGNQKFKVNVYPKAYEHFAQVHEHFYKRNT